MKTNIIPLHNNAMTYSFDPESAFNKIKDHWKNWDKNVHPERYVIGISGGIDSTCVAALACKIFGKDKVVGVSLPCNGQSDMADVDKVFSHLGIKRITIDIGDMFIDGLQKIENCAINLTDVCKINMPARLRMTMLYGIAQCIDGAVLNTCNRSESILSNDTLFGDNCGSYAPIQSLTKTEVKQLGYWLKIPNDLIEKTPIDGLQPLNDEDRLGIKYIDVDRWLRYLSDENENYILNLFFKGKFKLDMIHISGPKFEYPDKIKDLYGV